MEINKREYDRIEMEVLGVRGFPEGCNPKIDNDNKFIVGKIVNYYLTILPRFNFLFLLASSAILLFFRSWVNCEIGLLILTCSLLLEFTNGTLLVRQALVLWAEFFDKDVVSDPEYKIAKSHLMNYVFIPTKWYNNICSILCGSIFYVLLLDFGPFYGFISSVAICSGFWLYLKIIKVYRRYQFKAILATNVELLRSEFRISLTSNRMFNANAPRKKVLLGIMFIVFMLVFRYYFIVGTIYNVFLFSLVLVGICNLFTRQNLKLVKKGNFLYKPINPFLSKFLSFHDAGALLLDVIIAVLLNYLFYRTYPTVIADWGKFPIFFFVVLSLYYSHYIFEPGIISFFKRILQGNFKILVFRKFSSIGSLYMKSDIYPSLGAYGYLYSIQDKDFDRAKVGSNSPIVSALGDYIDFPYLSDKDWKANINYFLSIVDLVVFYWDCLPSANMIWELEITLEKMPKSRIVFIAPNFIVTTLKNWIDYNYQNVASSFFFIEYDPKMSQFQFKSKLYYFMRDIKKTPRADYP